MDIRLIEDRWLRKIPSSDGLRVVRLPEGSLLKKHDVSQDGLWLFVKPQPPFELIEKGWIEAASTTETNSDDISKQIEMAPFVRSCTFAARQLDLDNTEPYYVDRDYLIALAIHETNISNIESSIAGSDATGPFQITSTQWQHFLDVGDPDGNFAPETRLAPSQQPAAQAFFVYEATKLVSEAVTGAFGDDNGGGPYIPNYIELFVIHAFGASAGLEMIRQEKSGNTNRSAHKIVLDLAGDDQALILEKQKALLTRSEPGNEVIAEVYANIEKLFTGYLKKAYELVAEHTPEDLPVVAGGKPPWLAVAEQQLALDVREVAGAGANPKIVAYHGSTTLPHSLASSDETPWCASFVSWCMANSGQQSVIAANLRSARAADWRRWGMDFPRAASGIPKGAVVVLSPAPGSARSGHVGFYVRKVGADRIELLGGNQDNALSLKPFPNSKIASIRWFDWQPEIAESEIAPADHGGSNIVGPLSPDDWEVYRRTLGQKESSNTYTKENSLGYIGRWQFGALALDDIDYVRPGTGLKDLDIASSWLGKNGIDSKQDWFNSPGIQDSALIEYTRLYYKRLRQSGVIHANDSKGRVAGFLAAAHLVGPTGALEFSQGKIKMDANGTKASTYFQILSKAFGGSSTP